MRHLPFYANGIRNPDNKRAVMYIWQFGVRINGEDIITYGRTWEEFTKFIEVLSSQLELSSTRRLLVYVHNLPYEFGFMRKHFKWDKVFMLDDRKPVYCRYGGIEFRCSLKLSGGKSLAFIGEHDLVKHNVKKLVGDLDYELIRSPETLLTDRELAYCEYDIKVLLAYIEEKIEQDGNITRVPLTNTGYVRNYCRKACFARYQKYRNLMDVLTISPNEFEQLRHAFMGGHTHANAHYVRKVLHHVGSSDLTSSYPSVMALEKFPMSQARSVNYNISDEDFEYLIKNKACLLDVIFTGVMEKLTFEHPISSSKCWMKEEYCTDNGRIVSAGKIGITITEQDLITYSTFYSWESMDVMRIRYYEKQYLPKSFVASILNLYQQKTKLKGVEGEETQYMIYKNMANSAYGMTVTNPVRDEMEYTEDDEFIKTKPDLVTAIDKYNTSKRRFLYFPWGVWVTAYARRNLFTAIESIGSDFIYSDTDSVKYLNPEKHEKYFYNYNAEIYRKIERAADFHHFSPLEFSPANRKGEQKTIGLWDFEGIYDEFKTLGAKRYLVRKGDKWELTMAGANKRKAMEYLKQTGAPFEYFDDELEIPEDYSGRMTLTYIDDEIDGVLVDYNGRPYHYHEKSCIHMEKSKYNLTMSDDFINFLLGVRELHD